MKRIRLYKFPTGSVVFRGEKAAKLESDPVTLDEKTYRYILELYRGEHDRLYVSVALHDKPGPDPAWVDAIHGRDADALLVASERFMPVKRRDMDAVAPAGRDRLSDKLALCFERAIETLIENARKFSLEEK